MLAELCFNLREFNLLEPQGGSRGGLRTGALVPEMSQDVTTGHRFDLDPVTPWVGRQMPFATTSSGGSTNPRSRISTAVLCAPPPHGARIAKSRSNRAQRRGEPCATSGSDLEVAGFHWPILTWDGWGSASERGPQVEVGSTSGNYLVCNMIRAFAALSKQCLTGWPDSVDPERAWTTGPCAGRTTFGDPGRPRTYLAGFLCAHSFVVRPAWQAKHDRRECRDHRQADCAIVARAYMEPQMT